ncbi:MAG: SRPBCC family protein [Marmoricola sp.]
MTTAVDFAVPAEVAFDFLIDPRNRPLWQSSLRRVERIHPEEPVVGQTWTDVTGPGFRPAMVTTAIDRPSSWTERGTWRAVSAELTLIFEPTGTGCRVSAETLVRGPLVGRVLTALAPYAVRGDLARAARILSERASGK